MNGLQTHSQEKDSADIFIEYYEDVWQELYKFALYYLGNREDAEDVVQETAAEAFRSFSKLRDRSCFRPWIFKILSRKCKRFLRTVIRLKIKQSLRRQFPTAKT